MTSSEATLILGPWASTDKPRKCYVIARSKKLTAKVAKRMRKDRNERPSACSALRPLRYLCALGGYDFFALQIISYYCGV
jgi:hypothetical protein